MYGNSIVVTKKKTDYIRLKIINHLNRLCRQWRRRPRWAAICPPHAHIILKYLYINWLLQSNQKYPVIKLYIKKHHNTHHCINRITNYIFINLYSLYLIQIYVAIVFDTFSVQYVIWMRWTTALNRWFGIYNNIST